MGTAGGSSNTRSAVPEALVEVSQVIRVAGPPTPSPPLVVPKSHWEDVFQVAHYDPMAGHMRGDKTLNHITARFDLPGIWEDVHHWCAFCPECQLANQPAIPRAPLRPLPLMKVLFEQTGRDLIGP